MDTLLLVLMGVTVVAILLSFALVFMTGVLMKRGWKICIGNPEIRVQEEDVFDEEDVAPACLKDPNTICVENLRKDDVVYIETVTGSRYRFTLKSGQLRIFHLKGASKSRGKSYDMDVHVLEDFIPGRGIYFSTIDFSWSCRTSSVARILVDRRENTAVK